MSGGQQAPGRTRMEDGGSKIDRSLAGLFDLRSSILNSQWSISLHQIFSDEVMKLGGAKCFLKRLTPAQRPVEPIGAEQVLVVEDDVVNPDDLVFTELEVIQARPRLVHVHA